MIGVFGPVDLIIGIPGLVWLGWAIMEDRRGEQRPALVLGWVLVALLVLAFVVGVVNA